MKYLSTYLNFNGTCREAFTFYQACLGGELNVQTVGETPMAEHMPPAMHTSVLHAALTLREGVVLMGSDMFGPGGLISGNSMRVVLICESEEEIRTLFSKLGEGGTIGHPLETSFFGIIGDLTDQYGTSWMLEYDLPPQG